jgi:hypothetical protein
MNISEIPNRGTTLKPAANEGRKNHKIPEIVHITAQGRYQKLGAENKSTKVAKAPDRQRNRPTRVLNHRKWRSRVSGIFVLLCLTRRLEPKRL